MANTNDVTLRLRATLDTTQVKLRINELRKYQNTSGQGISSANSVTNGSVNPTGGNLAVNINNAIVRLNQILTQLNQSISRLATTNNIGLTKTQLINGGSREFASPISINEEYRRRLQNLRNEFKQRLRSLEIELGPEIMRRTKSQWILPDLPGDEKKLLEFDKRYQKFRKDNTKIQGPDFNGRMMKGFASQYIAGGIEQSLGNYSFDLNPKTRWFGEIAGAASRGIMTATMFQMMVPKASNRTVGFVGGGSAIASLIEAFGKMQVEKIYKTAEALRQANESFDVIYGTLKKVNSLQYDKKINGMSLGELTSERNSTRESFVKAEQEYYTNAEDVKKRMEKLQRENIKYMSSHEGKPMANYSNAMLDLETELLSYKEEFEKQKEIFEKVNIAYDRYIQALDNMTNIIKNAEKFDKSISDFNNGRVINKLIKDGRVGDLTNQRNEILTQIRGVIGKLSVILGIGGLKKYEEGTNELRQKLLTTTDEAEKASLNEMIRQREKLAESYKENAEEMIKLTQKMDGLDNSIEQIKEASKSLTQSADLIIKSYTDIDESNALKTALYGANGRDLGNATIPRLREASKLIDHYREMAKQMEKQAVSLANQSKDENLTLKERENLLEQSEKASDEASRFASLAGLDNTIEQIKEASKSLTQSADSIIKSYTDRDESNALKNALYGIQYGANGRDLGKAPILQFREASKLLDHYREMTKQMEKQSVSLANQSKNENLTLNEREDLLEQSEKAKYEASRFASLAGLVESFISGINTNLQKPDLTNVTSLGQYGFSMGENNDNQNRLQRYYDNVENLVEQIRNKLIEGIKTENTYN